MIFFCPKGLGVFFRPVGLEDFFSFPMVWFIFSVLLGLGVVFRLARFGNFFFVVCVGGVFCCVP